MVQEKQLLSLFQKEIYGTLWKSHHTKEYILDFLNSYFHFSGENKIRNIEIINPGQFTTNQEVRRRIHVTFEYLKNHYYYEIKLSSDEKEKRFDYTFLDFVHYISHAQLEYKAIGQIVLEFKVEHVGSPIDHYYFRNDHLELLEDSLDIHIIYLPTLKYILERKSIEELNRFERWIMIFMLEDFDIGKQIADGYTPMLSFLYLWRQVSRRIIERKIAGCEDKTMEYLISEKEKSTRLEIAVKLLLDGLSIELVSKLTGLPIDLLNEFKNMEVYQDV